jgi:hypothetical protein
MSRKVELIFAAFFAFCFINWLNFDVPIAFGMPYQTAGWYARNADPIYLHPPHWLRVFIWFSFTYGPFYLVVAYGFFRGRTWLPYVLLPLTGAVVASTGFFMAADLTGDVPPTNVPAYLSNALYIVFPVLASTWSVTRLRLRGVADS